MLRVMLEDADYCDVPADLMTFDDGVVVFWREGEEVGRHRQLRIQSLEVISCPLDGPPDRGGPQDLPERLPPLGPRRQEELLTQLFHDGVGKDVLVEALGRQPGGIEARLRTLDLLAEDETLQ